MRIIFLTLLLTLPLPADYFERPPVNYSKTEPHTPLTQIFDRIKAGEKLLAGETDQDILRELLQLLDIPLESQVLVYSKTSAQNARISPRRPRALYFSANAYVGWVQRGNIEVITFDPHLGAVFHLLDLRDRPDHLPPTLKRDNNCLTCHASHVTNDVPGLLIRSTYPTASGLPALERGSFHTDHSSPLDERWGGWYVTGTSGGLPHLGNRILSRDDNDQPLFNPLFTSPVTDLNNHLRSTPYLAGGQSDIVALMILEHQKFTHNALLAANLRTQYLLHLNQATNRNPDQPATQLAPSYASAIQSEADKVVRALLFFDEFEIPATGLDGNKAFQTTFSKNARRTRDGRSLRDLHLSGHLFKYRCSYLIHSQPFTNLPPLIKNIILTKIHSILTQPAQHPDFAYLGKDERQAILQILTETLPSFPPPHPEEKPSGNSAQTTTKS